MTTVSLSIKDVPADLANALRTRAREHHRSIQGELMDILELALRPRPFQAAALWEEIQSLGVRTSADSVAFVREVRDDRRADEGHARAPRVRRGAGTRGRR